VVKISGVDFVLIHGDVIMELVRYSVVAVQGDVVDIRWVKVRGIDVWGGLRGVD
jgi:hypothetical protein